MNVLQDYNYFLSTCPTQACDGTVKGLHQALLDIGRNDAVAVVDRFLQDEAARAQATSAQTKPHPSPGMHMVLSHTV